MMLLILEDHVEKTFLKLRDRYVRAKKELDKVGYSPASVYKLKERLESLKHLAWLGKYAKPRSATIMFIIFWDWLFDGSANFLFTKSETKHDYYYS